jgi:anti-anti-sigma regulatory factor
MLRITTHETSDSIVVLKLDGKLLEPWVEELKRCVTGSLAERTKLKLDLSGLVFADASGAKALLDLIDAGVSLTACSGYLAALLHVEKS